MLDSEFLEIAGQLGVVGIVALVLLVIAVALLWTVRAGAGHLAGGNKITLRLLDSLERIPDAINDVATGVQKAQSESMAHVAKSNGELAVLLREQTAEIRLMRLDTNNYLTLSSDAVTLLNGDVQKVASDLATLLNNFETLSRKLERLEQLVKTNPEDRERIEMLINEISKNNQEWKGFRSELLAEISAIRHKQTDELAKVPDINQGVDQHGE